MWDFIKAFIWRKLQEPSTWIPVVGAAAAYAHVEITGPTRDLIVTALCAIGAALFALINESRKPSGGPLGISKPSIKAGDPPAGSIERVPDSPHELPRDNVPSVLGRDLHSDARPNLPADVPRPVRPGFDK